jgi:phage terminase small subunit
MPADLGNLTAKQSKFVAEYLVDGNGARAAIAAGYGRAGARVRAHRLTRDNAAVQAEIAARQAQDGQRLALDRAAVISGILAGIEIAKGRMDGATVIRGWAELGKLMGMYAPQQHQVEVSAAVDAEMGRLERLSDAELLRLVSAAG